MLEQELGVTLLKRTKRRVELTHPGQIFLGEARRLLAGADDALQAVQSARAGQLGRVVLVCGPTPAYVGMLDLLRLYRRVCPQVEVRLIESPARDAIVTVEQGKADVGLVVQHFESPLLTGVTVLELPLLAALPASHPLASRDRLSIQQLSGEPFILFGERRSGLYGRVLAVCNSCGFTPQVFDEVEHLHSLNYLVGAGYGVSLMPATLEPTKDPGVVLIPLREPAATLEISMISRVDQSSPVVLGFLDTVRTWCKQAER